MPAKLKFEDYQGKIFGRLTILEDGGIFNGYRLFEAKCECGEIKKYRMSDIKNGKSTNCGCVRKEGLINRNTKHGLSETALYRVWKGLIERCEYENHVGYKWYGAKGIRVCREWKDNFISFKDWAESNGWEKGLQVDRENSEGDYSPSNCRIVTSKQNNRSKNSLHFIEYNGQTKCIAEWSDITGLPSRAIRDRINKLKWSEEKSLTTPLIDSLYKSTNPC